MWLDNHMRHMTTSLTNVRHSLEFVVVWSNTPSSCSSGIVTHRAWLCRTAVTWQRCEGYIVCENTSTRDSHWVGRGCVSLCSYPRVWSVQLAFYALCDYDASPPKQYIVVTLIAIVWKITSPSKRLVTSGIRGKARRSLIIRRVLLS